MLDILKIIVRAMPKINEIKQMKTSDRVWWLVMYLAYYSGWAAFLWFLVKVIGFKFSLG